MSEPKKRLYALEMCKINWLIKVTKDIKIKMKKQKKIIFINNEKKYKFYFFKFNQP